MKILSLLVYCLVLCDCVPAADGSGYLPSMTQTLTPAANTGLPATLTLPIDSEPANAASLVMWAQPILNGLAGAQTVTVGGPMRRRVSCTSNTVMTIQPFALQSTVGGVWKILPTAASAYTINPTTLTGGLGTSVRWWVYAWNNAGAVAFFASSTGPDAALQFMSGSGGQYLYITTFIVNAAGNVVKYSQADNSYTYLRHPAAGGGALDVLVLDVNTTGSGTVNYGYVVPMGAAYAKLGLQLQGGAGPVNASISGIGTEVMVDMTSTANIQSAYFEMPFGVGFDWALTNNTGQFSVWVNGFVL